MDAPFESIKRAVVGSRFGYSVMDDHIMNADAKEVSTPVVARVWTYFTFLAILIFIHSAQPLAAEGIPLHCILRVYP